MQELRDFNSKKCSTHLIETLYKKIEQLWIKEDGHVSLLGRGSFVIGAYDNGYIVKFGWNYDDTIKCIGANQLRMVVDTLIKNHYVFYHSEDMLVQFDGSEKDFGCYRKFPLYHP